MYDLVLRGGTVVDPSQALNSPLDVAVDKDGIVANGVRPDLAGVHAGVTTIVDAGSSGSSTFEAFPRYILPHNVTEVLPFLHICQTGLANSPDIVAAASID